MLRYFFNFPVSNYFSNMSIRDGPVNLVEGGGGSGRMTSEQFFFSLL